MVHHETSVAWSMTAADAVAASRTLAGVAASGEVSCIVCFEECDPLGEKDWHSCFTCSAVWCDTCMAQMFNTARDHEDTEVELTCPQCRGSIARMQETRRVGRLTGCLGCSEEAALELVAFENLLVEASNLCACEPDGNPFFTLPPGAVSRIMSRDAICDVVETSQGRDAGGKLRRSLRSEGAPRAAPRRRAPRADTLSPTSP